MISVLFVNSINTRRPQVRAQNCTLNFIMGIFSSKMWIFSENIKFSEFSESFMISVPLVLYKSFHVFFFYDENVRLFLQKMDISSSNLDISEKFEFSGFFYDFGT